MPNIKNITELTARASDDARDFISAIQNNYLTFSFIALFTLAQNFFQLFLLKYKDCIWKKDLEILLFNFLTGIFSIAVLK
jgi:hypothetical protein